MTHERKGTTMPNSFAPPTGRVVGADNFLTDGTHAVLRVTRCRHCGSAWFPARTQCSTCASRDVTEELTSSTGTAYASTVVQIAPPRFHAPYVLAYVDIDGVRVLAHAETSTALEPGTPVQLRLAPIGADEDGQLLSYTVAPTTEGDSR
jgi:uncharacterized protein